MQLQVSVDHKKLTKSGLDMEIGLESEWNLNKERFCSLWINQQIDATDTDSAEIVWNLITRHYSEQHRFYHTRAHILDCLKQLDDAKEHIPNPNAVELAIWFHDVIYDPAATDNEKQSAVLFSQIADKTFPESLIHKVSDLIMATMHIDQPDDEDQAYLLDIDLSSIASNWQRFTKDNSDLRKEEKHLTTKEYNEKKLGFFKMLLERERIFFTDFFHQACEEKARANMEKWGQTTISI